jgi:hypothetical protein
VKARVSWKLNAEILFCVEWGCGPRLPFRTQVVQLMLLSPELKASLSPLTGELLVLLGRAGPQRDKHVKISLEI